MTISTRKATTAAKTLREAAEDTSIPQRRKLREAAEILETYAGAAGDDTTETTED